jgi:hypothetical protein
MESLVGRSPSVATEVEVKPTVCDCAGNMTPTTIIDINNSHTELELGFLISVFSLSTAVAGTYKGTVLVPPSGSEAVHKPPP